MTTQMLCIEGTVKTNTVTGQVYNCVGRFVCGCCGKPSTILEFSDERMSACERIVCLGCGQRKVKLARYGNQARFVPLIDPDAVEEVAESREELVFGGDA